MIFDTIDLTNQSAGAMLAHPPAWSPDVRRSGDVRIISKTLSDQLTQDMYVDYLSGMSLRDVGRKYGMTHESVGGRFKRRNLPARSQESVPSKIVDCGSYAKILLHGRIVALIDSADIPLVEGRRWSTNRKDRNCYVYHQSYDGGIKTTEYLHRTIANPSPDEVVDHINHNGLDNRRKNLRVCSHAENVWNSNPNRQNTSSKFVGVSWHKARNNWRAVITENGRSKHIGSFQSEEDAAAAYDQYVRDHRDEYATTNASMGRIEA